jgi:hypothetical protein
MFQKLDLLPSSGRKARVQLSPLEIADLCQAVLYWVVFLLGLFFDPEDGSDILLWNVG